MGYYLKYKKYKHKYTTIKSIDLKQSGGNGHNEHKIINIDGRKYNRATMLVIECPDTNNAKKSVILFMDKKHKTYYEPGGRIDNNISNNANIDYNDILLKTAVRELQEESANSLAIHKTSDINEVIESKNYVDTTLLGTNYTRTFIVNIKPDQYNSNIYYRNLDILTKNELSPKHWKETISTNRFYIDDIGSVINSINSNKSLYDRKYIECVDVNGVEQKIWNLTAIIIGEYIRVFNNCNNNIRNSVIIDNNDNNNSFLNGTKTVCIV